MLLVTGLVLGFIGLAVSTFVVTTALGRARHAERQVVRERDRFRSQRDVAEENLYVADIRLAHEEWKQSHLTAVDTMLTAHLPRDGEKDLRGWEWYYVQSLCRRDVATLHGHSAGLNAVAWSQDGQRLATASDDHTVKAWDAVGMRELVALRGHKDLVESVTWSPDGKKLASASWDKTVRVWDVASGAAMEIHASDQVLRCVAWSPDGKRLASCGDDGLVKIWDATNGAELLSMGGHRDLVWEVAWSPDSRRLASVSNYVYRDMRIWNADTGELVHLQPEAHGFSILSVAWSPDAKQLATSSMDECVRVWDTSSWTYRTLKGHEGMITSVSWSPDGSKLVSGGADGNVILWDPNDDAPVRTFRGHRGRVSSVNWRSDGKRIASASGDATARIWDPNQDQEFTQIRTAGAIVWSPNGARLASVVREPVFGIQIYDALNGLPLGSPIAISGPRSSTDGETTWAYAGQVAWSPSGQQIACGLTPKNKPRDAIIKIIDIQTGTDARSLPIPHEIGVHGIRTIEWSPDSRYLAAGTMDDHGGRVVVWDIATGEPTAQLWHHAPLESVAWSPNGNRLATASWDNIVKIWDTTSWREMMRFNRHPELSGTSAGGPHMVAWSPDGSELAAGTRLGWVIVWDLASGREILSFSAHTAPIRSLAYSPNGHRLATVSRDHDVKIWNANGGQHLLTLSRHSSGVDDVSWSPDGVRLQSSDGGKHLIWDASIAMSESHDK